MRAISWCFRDFDNFIAIIDNHLPQTGVNQKFDLPVISYDEFKSKHSKNECIICISLYNPDKADEVRKIVRADGYVSFIHREIINVKKGQYFDFFHENNLFVPDEVFVHMGSSDGYNEECFVEHVENKYKKIIAFEPSPFNFEKCKEALVNLRDCHVVKAGCGDKSGVIKFHEEFTGDLGGYYGSKVSDKGNMEIKIFALDEYWDEYCKNDIVTLIAMDTEGYELKALQGAAGIIKEHKPKLAISIYHKHEDIYEIPLYIKSLNPDYKLAIRLYGNNFIDDGICYAY